MKRAAILCLLLMIIAGRSLSAQIPPHSSFIATTPLDSAASIGGCLKDERGNPIVGAYVECNVEGVVQATELTDIDGRYIFSSPDSTTMTLTFKFQGRELVVTNIKLRPNEKRTFHWILRLDKDPSQGWWSDRLKNSGFRGCNSFRFPDFEQPGGHVTHSGDMLW